MEAALGPVLLGRKRAQSAPTAAVPKFNKIFERSTRKMDVQHVAATATCFWTPSEIWLRLLCGDRPWDSVKRRSGSSLVPYGLS